MSSNNTEKYKAPALEKGLEIIEYLALQPTAQSQSEIAMGLNRSPNEIYRMLAALEAKGYIRRDQVSAKYALTLKLYYLSRRHSFVEKLRAAAQQVMKETSNIIQEPCHLCVIHDNQVMVIAYSKSPSPIAIMIEEGNLYSIAQTTSGKLLLSFSDVEDRASILRQDTYYQKLSKIKRQKFDETLAEIKRLGYYHMPSAYAEGVSDISVPIGNDDTGIIACLTVSKLIKLESKDDVPVSAILTELQRCKLQIEANLGLV